MLSVGSGNIKMSSFLDVRGTFLKDMMFLKRLKFQHSRNVDLKDFKNIKQTRSVISVFSIFYT